MSASAERRNLIDQPSHMNHRHRLRKIQAARQEGTRRPLRFSRRMRMDGVEMVRQRETSVVSRQ